MALSPVAFATEGGSDTIGEGDEAFFAGALAPAGLYDILYYSHYHASHFNDSHSNNSVLGFKIDADLLIPLRRIYVESDVAGLTLRGLCGTAARTAFGECRRVAVQPNQSRRHGCESCIDRVGTGALRTTVAVEFVLPSGQYDKNAVLNTGKNSYTAGPVFAVSWLPNERMELSAKVTRSFNSPNNDTNYHSGNLFHFDYSASCAVTPAARVGISGYFIKQTTDDVPNGQSVAGDGFRGQVFAMGPGLRFRFSKVSVEARVVKEFIVRNRPAG
jgi:hypothetical protein